MFHIVQPYANGPRRLEHATVVSSHRTVDDAFDELERVEAIFITHGLTTLASDLTVVTDEPSPVRACVRQKELTATAATSERHPNGNGQGKSQVAEVTAPTEGWDFAEPTFDDHVALMPHGDGRVEVWRVEPDGTFSRMHAVEEDLGHLARVAIAPPSLATPTPPLRFSRMKPQAHLRSFWSDYRVRIRWPKAIGPVVTIARMNGRFRGGRRELGAEKSSVYGSRRETA